MVTTSSSLIIEAEALDERDKENVAIGYALQAETKRINELTKERFDAIGRGDISVELCNSTVCDTNYSYYSSALQAAHAKIYATGSQVTYQSNQYVNDKDTLNDVFLPITNLFDRIPDFLKVDPVLIGFFVAIFITSIYIGRQFSHKKRIARRNRRDWRRKLKELIAQNTWRHRSNDEPGILRVTPEEYRRMQEFERSFVTVGKSDPEYFLHVTSGAKLIDASRRGNELYSINTIIHGRSLKILKYRDPSTKVQDPITGEWVGQLYISFVPEHINKADHGMAWKFRLTPGEYRRTKRHEA
jgi:hypothetical protein